MNAAKNVNLLSDLLGGIAQSLDVPASKYEEAKQHYEAVGNWLGAPGSQLAAYQPTIYPQGSFALGTAVRPLGDDEYDVDAVCLLQLTPSQVTQQQLKEMVGARLSEHGSRYKDMLDPKDGGRRCWTIKYADGSKFHLDVLPAIPDDVGTPEIDPDFSKHAILITCKDTWDSVDQSWPRSNPKGYAAWFKSRMVTSLMEAKRVLAQATRTEVEEIEDFRVRTPLQRLVQLLKRHRDQRYNGDEDKPISIIITTLAAMAYDNEADISDALLSVVPKMRDLVTKQHGVWWVPNPVNPRENFADKWANSPRKAQLFFEWLAAVEQEHRYLLTDASLGQTERMLTEAYGELAVREALSRHASENVQPSGPTVIVPRKSGIAVPVTSLPDEPSKPWSE